jgi:hypothetical protein
VVSFRLETDRRDSAGTFADRGMQGVDDMANDRGPFRPYGRHNPEDIGRQFYETMNSYCNWWRNNTSGAPGAMGRVHEHMNDAAQYVNKLSQAREYQDVLGANAAFVQKKLDMFNDRARQITDVLAVAGNLVGSFASLLAYRQATDETARTSPRYQPDDASKDASKPNRTWVPDR